MTDMFYSVVANQRQPQNTYKYNVLQRRPRPTIIYIYIYIYISRGRGAYSVVACLSDLTIDHAYLSRRSTVPTPNSLIETPPTLGRSLRFCHIFHWNCLLILSPSCFAVCGHHLSPWIAIVFSLLSSLHGGGVYMGLSTRSQSHCYDFAV